MVVYSLLNMQRKKLSELVPGESGVVWQLTNTSLTPKLAEMGLLKGKRVTVLFQAPFNGPMAIDVDGYTLSLRTEEAALVDLESNLETN